MSKDYKDLLLRFADGRETARDRNLLENLIGKLVNVKNLERLFQFRWGDDYQEELISILREKLIRHRKSIQEKEFIARGYVNSILYTAIVDFLKEINTKEVSFSQLRGEEEEQKNWLENSKFFSYTEDKESFIEGEEIYKLILDIIKPSDYSILCYYLCKEASKNCRKPEGITETTLYKRWERIKKKIASSIPQTPSETAFRYFVNKFMSEICIKGGFINEEGENDEAQVLA
ncbi:hypothetical protein [Thermocrinis sp.]